MLEPIFRYSLTEFCDRYDISSEYVADLLAKKYPQLAVDDLNLIVLLSEVDLLIMLELGSFDGLDSEDPRKEAKIQLYPRE